MTENWSPTFYYFEIFYDFMNHKIIQIDLVMVILKFCDRQLIKKFQTTRRGNRFDQFALTQVYDVINFKISLHVNYHILNIEKLLKFIMMEPWSVLL